MANLYTPLEIIGIAKVSQVLVDADIDKGSMFPKKLDERWGRMLYIERKSLEWAYNQQGDNFPDIRNVANYVYAICYKGITAASLIIDGGGGSITPVTPTTVPDPLHFTVDGSTPVPTGVGVVTFPQFIGWNILFNRNNIPQSTVNRPGETYYSYNKTTGVFQAFGAANAGELFDIIPYLQSI